MNKHPTSRQPWEWKQAVRSRANEIIWFAFAATFATLFSLGLLLHGSRALVAWDETAFIVVITLAVGFWNRKKRKQEQARDPLP